MARTDRFIVAGVRHEGHLAPDETALGVLSCVIVAWRIGERDASPARRRPMLIGGYTGALIHTDTRLIVRGAKQFASCPIEYVWQVERLAPDTLYLTYHSRVLTRLTVRAAGGRRSVEAFLAGLQAQRERLAGTAIPARRRYLAELREAVFIGLDGMAWAVLDTMVRAAREGDAQAFAASDYLLRGQADLIASAARYAYFLLGRAAETVLGTGNTDAFSVDALAGRAAPTYHRVTDLGLAVLETMIHEVYARTFGSIAPMGHEVRLHGAHFVEVAAAGLGGLLSEKSLSELRAELPAWDRAHPDLP